MKHVYTGLSVILAVGALFATGCLFVYSYQKVNEALGTMPGIKVNPLTLFSGEVILLGAVVAVLIAIWLVLVQLLYKK